MPLAGEGKENATPEERRKRQDVRQRIRERAVEELSEATRLAPRNSEYHRELGNALNILGDRDEEGLTELRKAVALDPADALAHKALAAWSDGEEAKAAYRAAVRLDPNDVYTRIELGTMLLNENDANGAFAEFRAAVRIDPKNEKAHLRLGTALEELGQMDKAIEEYRTSVTLGPVLLGPAFSYRVKVLAEALAKVGRRKEAGQVIRDYLKLEPEGGPTGESFFRERLQELDRE